MPEPIDLSQIRALTWDIGGTVFNWHDTIKDEVSALAASRGVELDPAKFTNTWRRSMFVELGKMRAGELPRTNADGLHRMVLDELAAEYPALELTPADRDALNTVWHRMRAWPDAAAALARLRELLPPRFEDLPGPFGAGVRGPDGRHALLTSGSLPEAVAASCAMPVVFTPVEVDGVLYQDGGAVDRLGIDRWRALRGDVPTVIHWVDRTAGKEDDVEVGDAVVAQTPRSGANFWNLGDVSGQLEEARRVTAEVLAAV